jgi:copper chaperone
MAKVTLHIEGMSCGHCLNAVNKALNAIPGAKVERVQIGRAELELADDGPSMEAVAAAVSAEGYPATAVRAG